MASRFTIYDEQIIPILKQGNDRPYEIAKEILKSITHPDYDGLGKYISRHRKSLLDEHEGIYVTADTVDVAPENVPYYWDKTDPTRSVFVKNPDFVPQSLEKTVKDIDFLSIFKDKIHPVTLQNEFKSTSLFDRLVFTDVHVGMDVNKDGFAMYDGVWNEVELDKRLEIMISHVLLHQKSDTLYIDELGDFLDGWDSKTVRREHELPQNMDNQKAFDTALRFKVKLIDSLIQHYNKIVSRNVTDDNHAGAFAYVVNSAFKTIMDLKYPDNVEVVIQRKFIDHYQVGKHIFILCHGKDGKNLKFGFKPILDKIQENKIDNYIKEHYLLQKGVQIEFSKGDSHQYIFDNSTSTSFRYCNYIAFSPPSNWVKTNFMNSISGFVSYNYYENMQRTVNDYIFL